MGAHNFWDNFSHGFMHGMFNSNPFFGCFNFGWGYPFMQNNFFMPPQFNIFQPSNMFMYPSMNCSVFPLMQDFSSPAFNFQPMNNLFDFSSNSNTNFWDNNLAQNSWNWDFGDIFTPNTEPQEQKVPESQQEQKTKKAPETPKTTNNTSTEVSTPTVQPVSSQNTSTQKTVLKTENQTQTVQSAQPSKGISPTITTQSVKSQNTSTSNSLGGISINTKITEPFNGTAAQLDKILGRKNGVLKGKGYKFLQMQEKYGLNAAILAAICCGESSYGTSNLAVKYNNVCGISGKGAPNGFRKFNSVDECIEEQARLLKENYVDKGLVTIHQIHMKYCPPIGDKRDTQNLNAGWGNLVSGITRKIYA